MGKWKRIAKEQGEFISACNHGRRLVEEDLRKGLGEDRTMGLPALARKARDVLLIQSAEMVRLRQELNAACEDTVAPLGTDKQSALGLVALAETAAAHLADLATLRQQAATDRKLAGEAADEAARLQEELLVMTSARDGAANARDHWKGEAASLRAAWNQETADRVKAEEAPRALPWRDAKTDPPPVDEYVLGQWGPQSFNEVRRAADDEWRDLTGDALDTPFHWLPLSALEPGECVTVDLPEVGYIGVDRWTLIKCGEGVAECPIWLPAGTQIPARWKGKRLRLTLEPAAGPAGEAKPDDRANHLRLLLAKVDLRGRSFQIGAMGSGHYLQIVYRQTCVDTGEEKEQHGRKWYLSAHATDGEVVQTALKAALTSAEHEVREHFTYQGARVFGPHFDLDALVSLCQQGSTQKRQP